MSSPISVKLTLHKDMKKLPGQGSNLRLTNNGTI